MSTIFTRIINKLCGDSAIKMQVMISLYADRVYHSMKMNYNQKVRSIYWLLHRRLPSEGSLEHLHRLDNWDWRGIPDMHWFFVWYEYFTTLYLMLLIAKILSISYLENALLSSMGIKLSKPLGCYLPGRFFLTTLQRVDLITVVVAAMMHLTWRRLQYAHKQDMNLHYFLLFTRRDLDHYNCKFLTVDKQKQQPQQANRKTNHQKQQEKSESASLENALVECLFHETLSYRVQITKQLQYYRLRPNRTPRANDDLRKLMSIVFVCAVVVIAIITAILTPFIWLEILSEQHLVDYYPNCEIDPTWFRSSLDPRVAINWHRLTILIIDYGDNALLWIETGFSVFYGVELAALLNFDLYVYWQNLHENVLKLHHFLTGNYAQVTRKYFDRRKFTVSTFERYENIQSEMKASTRAKNASQDQSKRQPLSLDRRNTFSPVQVIDRCSTRDEKQLDELMHELRFQLHDFFIEIKHNDTYMSDVLTFTLIIWFSIFLAYIYISIDGYVFAPEILVQVNTIAEARFKPGTSPYHLLIVIIPMVALTVIYWSLLDLHRRCLITYRYLCPIMAMYQSDRRRTFLPILDYFSDRRTCYSLFRMTPFLPTTYLSIVGWSFSCFFVLRTLLEGGGHRPPTTGLG